MDSASSGQRKCCYINCPLTGGMIESNYDSKVEVKTVMPSASGKAIKKMKDEFVVSWKTSGEAVFHAQCWENLLVSARARKYRKPLPKLAFEEKVLVKEAAKTAEYHDSLHQVQLQAVQVAKLIGNAKYCVAFTGAGISTSAGIGDFRGKSGKWTEADHDALDMDSLFETPAPVSASSCDAADDDSEDLNDTSEPDVGVPYEDLRPTYTHEALTKLLELGKLKYVISQNADGLHILSGIPTDKISELHGNVFQERCEECASLYNRCEYVLDDVSSQYFEEIEDNGNTEVSKPPHAKKCHLCGLNHRTGRKCEKKGCPGYLCDTIINFRDNLEDDVFEAAENHSRQCDLMLSLGSTMTVTPASDLVDMIQRPYRLVICNRQKTSMDNVCSKRDSSGELLGARVFGDCDIFMKQVMKNILSPADLQAWEGERQSRLKQYSTQRVKSTCMKQ